MPPARPVGRVPDERKRELGVQKAKAPGTSRKRQADRSDVRQKCARFTKPEPVSGPRDKRTGASPSCLKSISRPLPSRLIPSVSSASIFYGTFKVLD